MKIGDLDMHCGNCELVGYCGDPFEYAICCARPLAEMEETEYLRLMEEMWGKYKDYEQAFEMICEKAGGRK